MANPYDDGPIRLIEDAIVENNNIQVVDGHLLGQLAEMEIGRQTVSESRRKSFQLIVGGTTASVLGAACRTSGAAAISASGSALVVAGSLILATGLASYLKSAWWSPRFGADRRPAALAGGR